MGENGRIMIVDDEPSARDTLEALLFREGYDLYFAASGHEALNCLEDLVPDVILLDVMMPNMDGFEVCQRLKSDKQWRHIPIILVTALDSKQDLVRGLDAGADDFLHKPVSTIELRARLRSMLRIKRQYDGLKATLQLREDLSRMIVHDMRNPLSSILLYGHLLRRNITSPDVSKYVEMITSDAQRLNLFIDDILTLAKMEHGKLILNRSPVDVNHFVLEIQGNHRDVAEAKGIDLAVDLPKESQLVCLDANLFQRMLDNLITNALKFSPKERVVTLRVEYTPISESQNPGIRIAVLDQGPGIPEEFRERIFDQFEIIKAKEEGISQVGLGLAFCKMVVEAHAGRIWVDANEPVGSVFTVEI